MKWNFCNDSIFRRMTTAYFRKKYAILPTLIHSTAMSTALFSVCHAWKLKKKIQFNIRGKNIIRKIENIITMASFIIIHRADNNTI